MGGSYTCDSISFDLERTVGASYHRLQQFTPLLQRERPVMPQVQGDAQQHADVPSDALRPWVLELQRSVAELRGVLADLGAKHWQLQVRRQSAGRRRSD